MTQKMQTLIVTTSEEIVSAVDDCLLGNSKRSVAQRLLSKFATTLEAEFVANNTPAKTTNTTAE